MAKSKLTTELVKTLCELKGKGLSNKAVCDGVAISESVFYDWLAKGEEALLVGKKNKFSEFLEAYKKAETDFKLSLMAKIQQESGKGSWTASAWLLERCYPAEFGKKTIELTGKDGGAIQTEAKHSVDVMMEKLSDEDLLLLEQMALKIEEDE
ncbi:MAG: hypothetical protein R3Y63_08930 [Eubacteriales bacterium]